MGRRTALLLWCLWLRSSNGFFVPPVSLRLTPLHSSGGNADEVAPFLRRPAPPGGDDASAVVLLPESRVLMPGATRTFHFYDSNLLAALQHALAHDNELVILGYDTSSRRLKYGPGTLATVGTVEDAVRENRLKERSASKIVSVTGRRPVKVDDVLQYEPFMLAKIAPRASEEEEAAAGVDEEKKEGETGEAIAAMVVLCNEVMALRNVLSVPLLQPTSDGRPDDTTADPNALLASSSASSSSEVDADSLVAWTCAQHCLPEQRARALALGSGCGGEGEEGAGGEGDCDAESLVAYVSDALEETKRTLLAMKSLQALGGGGGDGGDDDNGDSDSE